MSFNVVRIFGITIRIHYSLLLIFLLITWSLALGYMPQQFPGLSEMSYWIIGILSGLILIISVVIHELCHSIVANKLGLPIKRITLFFLGGAAEMTEEPESPDVEFKMAVVGPLSSFAIAIFLGGLWYIFKTMNSMTELIAITQYGATINIMLGGFNLLPAFPLDGGRVFRSILWKQKGSLIKATKMASKVGIGLSYAMMFGGFVIMIFGGFFSGLWIIIIGSFIKSSAEEGLSQTIISQVLAGTTIKEIMSKDVVTVEASLSLDDLAKEYFLLHKFAGYPVLKDGVAVGLVTMDDVKDVSRVHWKETIVRDVMKPIDKLVVVDPETPASDAMYKMSTRGVGRILVMKDNELIGIVSQRDLTHLIKAKVEFD